jgi:hypothetical protein
VIVSFLGRADLGGGAGRLGSGLQMGLWSGGWRLGDADHRDRRGDRVVDLSPRGWAFGDRDRFGLGWRGCVLAWLLGFERRFGEQTPEAACEVTLEAAQRALLGLALGFLALNVLLGAGSCWARVIAIVCSARLSWRSPPRSSRCWVRCPEEQGIGAVPDWRPKQASERNRSAPAVRPISSAAVSVPHPCS